MIFYFLLMPGLFFGSAVVQDFGNEPDVLVERLTSKPNSPSAASNLSSPNRCESSSNCFYSNVSNFHCGESEIAISSTCVSNDQFNSDPYCFIQNVAFIKLASRETKSFNYNYETDNQKHIVGAKCVKTKIGFYVALENSNLGNCHTCEWNDYFDEKGKYLGSEKGMYGNTSFVRKLLPMKNKREIQKGQLARRIDITTIAK